jgi:hypothetical protein
MLEYECTFRRSLRKSLPQTECIRPDIWSIDQSGSNIGECVEDALGIIEREGLAWFGEFSDPQKALQFLERPEEEEFDRFGPFSTWGFGRPGSPARTQAITYLRRALDAT